MIGLCLGHANNPAEKIDYRTPDISVIGLCLGHANNPAEKINYRTPDISVIGLCLGHANNPAEKIDYRTPDISVIGLCLDMPTIQQRRHAVGHLTFFLKEWYRINTGNYIPYGLQVSCSHKV